MRFSEKETCPIDPEIRDACTKNRKLMKIGFYISLSFYIFGVSFSYIIPRIIYG